MEWTRHNRTANPFLRTAAIPVALGLLIMLSPAVTSGYRVFSTPEWMPAHAGIHSYCTHSSDFSSPSSTPRPAEDACRSGLDSFCAAPSAALQARVAAHDSAVRTASRFNDSAGSAQAVLPPSALASAADLSSPLGAAPPGTSGVSGLAAHGAPDLRPVFPAPAGFPHAAETGVIRRAALANGIDAPDDWLILLAIRCAENGRPGRQFGVLHPKAVDTDLRTQAGWAAATIVANRRRWDGRGDFIDFLAGRYCPAESDPVGHANWKRNVRLFYAQFKQELIS